MRKDAILALLTKLLRRKKVLEYSLIATAPYMKANGALIWLMDTVD